MRIDTTETKVYRFNELSDEAKESVIQNHRENCFDYDWWEWVYEDAQEIGKILGIDIDRIYFSGFWSKGDGACFDGNYAYAKQAVKNVKEYAPKDDELRRIAQNLLNIQRTSLYSISASIKQSGHYMHRFCTDICVDFENVNTGIEYYCSESEDAVIELLRDFMLWIYKRLETTWDDITSDETIALDMQESEQEFTVDGKVY